MEIGRAIRAWLGRWDPWPLIRLLAVFAAAWAWLRWRFQWVPPSPSELTTIGEGLCKTFLVVAVLSTALAEVFLVILLFPLYAIVVLQDWFYEASHRVLELALGSHSPRLTAGMALIGELGLFLASWSLAESLLARFCHW